MSAAYLSRVERGVFPPPAEKKLLALAMVLGEDPDQFLAMGGRVASDLPKIIRRHPRQCAALLRAMKGLPGANAESNLITLCCKCHRKVHEHAK